MKISPFTAAERRGLIALLIVLALLVGVIVTMRSGSAVYPRPAAPASADTTVVDPHRHHSPDSASRKSRRSRRKAAPARRSPAPAPARRHLDEPV